MKYTTENYEQDKRIAAYIFNKNFKGHYLKDDLIQTAVVALWQLRQNGRYKDYVNCACKTAFNHMVDFLRKENRNFADSLFDNVSGDNDVQLIDILVNEQPTAQEYIEYQDLMQRLIPLTAHLSGRDRKIIIMHLKHYTQQEIAGRVGGTRQNVSLIIQKFRNAVRLILGE